MQKMVEEYPAGIPLSLGVEMKRSGSGDEDHCQVSEKQNAVESATFVAELIANQVTRSKFDSRTEDQADDGRCTDRKEIAFHV